MIIAKPLSNYSEVIFNHTFVIVTTSSIVICRILDFVSASKIFICNDGNPNMQQSLIALSEIKEIWMATGIYSASSVPVASKISEQLVKFQTVLNNLQDEILQLKKALNN